MEFHLLNRLAEVRSKLGPYLEALGVRAKIVKDSEGFPSIEFKSKDGKTFCPVEITLGTTAKGGPMNGWGGSVLRTYLWEEADVGHNGWKHQFFGGMKEAVELEDDKDQSLEAIDILVRGAGVVYAGRSKDKFTDDEDFGDAFFAIEDALTLHGEIVVNCERSTTCDSYTFRDPGKQEWRIAFRNEKATISLDGKRIASLPSHDRDAIGGLIEERLSRYLDRSPFKR